MARRGHASTLWIRRELGMEKPRLWGRGEGGLSRAQRPRSARLAGAAYLASPEPPHPVKFSLKYWRSALALPVPIIPKIVATSRAVLPLLTIAKAISAAPICAASCVGLRRKLCSGLPGWASASRSALFCVTLRSGCMVGAAASARGADSLFDAIGLFFRSIGWEVRRNCLSMPPQWARLAAKQPSFAFPRRFIFRDKLDIISHSYSRAGAGGRAPLSNYARERGYAVFTRRSKSIS